MILGKLFEIIFSENIKIIITTNTKLNELYKSGALSEEEFNKAKAKLLEN